MAALTEHAPAARSLPGWARVAAVPVTAILTLLGLWIFAGVVAPSYGWSIALGFAWFAVAYVALRFPLKRLPALRWPVTGTFAIVGLVIGVWFAVTTFRDVEVNEQIVVGVAASDVDAPPIAGDSDRPEPVSGSGDDPASAPPATGNVQLSSGEFETLAHSSSGTAAIVRLEDGSHVLTFDDLSTDNGPDLRVYLVAGEATSGSVGEFVDLGGLKGNKGDQQYAIPADVDVSRFTTVAIWCRAFSVGFARAALVAS